MQVEKLKAKIDNYNLLIAIKALDIIDLEIKILKLEEKLKCLEKK